MAAVFLIPRRNRAEHLLDPLATGAILFQRPDWKAAAPIAHEETLWLLGIQGVDQFDSMAEKPSSPRTAAFLESGIYLMADPAPAKAQLLIDAGPHGSLSGGHGHADALSVHLSAEGGELLLDPGTCCYVSADNSRNEFRGTAAHNTLRVAKSDQAKPESAFSWEGFVDTTVESWITGTTFELFRGSHSGYARLAQPLVHCRWVFHLRSQFWLVRDVVLGEGEHSVDLFWHIAPGFLPRRESSGTILFEHADGSRFALLTTDSSGWIKNLRKAGGRQYMAKREPAPVVHLSRQSALPTECYSMFLAPCTADKSLGRLVPTKNISSACSISVCTYERLSETYEMVFSESKQTWRAGRIESDARFLYCAFDAEKQIRHFILCDGSFMKLAGQLIFATEHAVAFHEWSAETDESRVIARKVSSPGTAGRAGNSSAQENRLAMCGICGILNFNRKRAVERGVLEEMNRQIIHRGPDDAGFYLSGNIGMAMRRLSIIDVQSGHQPITNEDDSVALVFNGEIYNHQELRQQLEKRGSSLPQPQRYRNDCPSL